MKKITSQIIIGTFLLFLCTSGKAQAIKELYLKEDFTSIITFADKADELTKDELYMVGFAYFQLENDKQAIEFYDKAIAKGLDDEYIYLYKGLALRFDKQPEKALENFKLAKERNPESQEVLTELGNSYYYEKDYDTALDYFIQARALTYELGDPYLKVPNIYHIQGNYEKALEEYRASATLIYKKDPAYLELLTEIGLLEYAVFKNFDKSVEAYTKVVALDSTNYNWYPKLIKAHYANETFEEGNQLIAKVKEAYDKGLLPKSFQEQGYLPIAEFNWKEQRVSVFKNLRDVTETLDVMYQIYLLDKEGKSVERNLMTEKTIQLDENGPKHLLCEVGKDGGHSTYSYGWPTDDIDFTSLKEAAFAVFNKELNPSASSNFNSLVKPEETKKEKKKKKKKKKSK